MAAASTSSQSTIKIHSPRAAANEALRDQAFQKAQESEPPATLEVGVAELRPFRWSKAAPADA